MGARSAGIRAGAAVAIAAGVVLASALPAMALPAGTVGTFPTWSIGGTANNFSGTATFASPTLTSPTITSDSVTAAVATGGSAYLGAGTGFGAEFGSTRSQPYLTLRPQTAAAAPSPPSATTPPPSTTTIDFGSSAPAPGWGFALGDIDADWVTVTGYDAGNNPVAVTALHAQPPANYCDTTPKPSTCSGVNAPFDTPNWLPSGGVVGSINYAAGTVYGNTADTTGAYIWFLPDPTVRRITLLYGALSGTPVYQLWLAQPAPQTTITGSVAVDAGGPPPAGTSVQLNAADGTPITDLGGDPLTVPVDPAGGYSIVTEQRDEYQLQVLPPPGYATPAPITIAANSATVTAPTIALDPAANPPTVPVASAAPTLAESGVDAWPPAALALLLLLLGTGAALAAARR